MAETWLEAYKAALQQRDERIAELTRWVSDLQSGMFVNCVYCGHRYGPENQVPTTMADALKAHIEQCKQHPMSALKARLEAAETKNASAYEDAAKACEPEYPDDQPLCSGWVRWKRVNDVLRQKQAAILALIPKAAT